MSSVTQKASKEATADRPSTGRVERGSVRKLEKSNGHESARKMPSGAAHAQRESAAKLPASNGHRESATKLPAATSARDSSAKLERPSARHKAHSDRPSKPTASDRPSKPTASERPSKANVAAQAAPAANPVKKRGWKRELFRAMFDALRDILRAERRPSV